MNEINQEQNKVSCKLFDVQTASTVADCARLIEQGYEYVATHSYGPNMGVTLFFRKPIALTELKRNCYNCLDRHTSKTEGACEHCEEIVSVYSNWNPRMEGSP